MVAITKLALYTLAIVIFIILLSFFFGSGSGFAAVKEVFSGVKESVNLSIGAEEVEGEKPELPKEFNEPIGNLKRTIETMQGKEACFSEYKVTGGGSNEGRNGLLELGEDGVSIVFEKDGNNMQMVIFGGVGGQQEISREIIAKTNPCVISGEKDGNNIPLNFYQRHLQKQEIATETHFLPVEKITITYDGENRISYNNGDLLDFEDGGFLYTPDGKQVCFFPTKDGDGTCDGETINGLDDDCLGNAREDDLGSITKLYKAGELKVCQ